MADEIGGGDVEIVEQAPQLGDPVGVLVLECDGAELPGESQEE